MPVTISGPKGRIATLAEWFANAPPKGKERQWKNGRSAKEIARAWCPEGSEPEVPIELADLLKTGPFENLQIREVRAEARIVFDAFPGEPRNADLAIAAADSVGPVAITVEAKADESFGDRVEKVLVDAARRISREENSNAVARVQGLSRGLLPGWQKGLPQLGQLRYQLLTGIAGTLALAREIAAIRAVFIVHELVDPRETKESARRKNREDFDQFLCRLTGKPHTKLGRGALLGPLRLPGAPDVELFIGKIRRDL